MLDKLLRAKHWLLFVLVIGVPLVIQIFFMSNSMAASMGMGSPEEIAEQMKSTAYISPLIMVLPNLIMFGWYLAVLSGLQDKVPAEANIPFNRVRGFLVYSVIWLIIFAFIMGYFFSTFPFAEITQTDKPEEVLELVGSYGLVILAILPFHLFMVFCMIYSFVYVGKTIKTAETGKNHKFGEYAGEFALSWFWFVGIWILQPRIQKLLGYEDSGPKERVEEDVL